MQNILLNLDPCSILKCDSQIPGSGSITCHLISIANALVMKSASSSGVQWDTYLQIPLDINQIRNDAKVCKSYSFICYHSRNTRKLILRFSTSFLYFSVFLLSNVSKCTVVTERYYTKYCMCYHVDMVVFYMFKSYIKPVVRGDPLLISPGGGLNIKMSSYQYRDPHVEDKMVSRPSYLNHGNPIHGTYWYGALVVLLVYHNISLFN